MVRATQVFKISREEGRREESPVRLRTISWEMSEMAPEIPLFHLFMISFTASGKENNLPRRKDK